MDSSGSEMRTVESRYVYNGRILQIREDQIERPDGTQTTWVVVEHPGAVVLAPLDADGNVLLVRQPRYAAKEPLLELPAGTMEPGESPEVTARRELHEETGHDTDELVAIGGFYSAPGFCDEYLHLFVARGLRPVVSETHDDDEEITLVPTPLTDVPDLIRRGEIKDAKTIAGLLRVLYVEN